MGRKLLDVIDTLARAIAILKKEMKGSPWRGSIEEAWNCGQGFQWEDEDVVTPPTSSTRHACAEFWTKITAPKGGVPAATMKVLHAQQFHVGVLGRLEG